MFPHLKLEPDERLKRDIHEYMVEIRNKKSKKGPRISNAPVSYPCKCYNSETPSSRNSNFLK